MFQKTFALTVRALRVDARQFSPHFMRGGLCLFVLLFLMTTQLSFEVQAPGKTLFSWIIYTNVIFASFAVPLLFANAITEEKEERMLPLLQIANVSPLTILVGKSLPRMLSILLIFIVQFPFSMLAITLGGISLSQIIASYFAVAAYVIFLGFASLSCSVVCRLTANAMGLAGFLVLGYHFLPYVVYLLLEALRYQYGWDTFAQAGLNLLTFHWETNVYQRLNNILATGFNEGVLSWQVLMNLGWGGLFFFFSWGVFNWYNQDTATEPVPRVSRVKFLRRNRSRVWDFALAWKEFQFSAGGRRALVAKFSSYGALIVFVALVTSDWDLAQVGRESLWFSASVLFFVFLPLEVVLMVSRLFAPEIRDKTLSSLCMLPLSTQRLAYSKVAGGLMGILPVATYLALLGLSLEDLFESIPRGIMRNPFDFAVGLSHTVTQGLIYLHLVVWFSLRMNSWSAIIVAFFVQYFGLMVVFMTFALLSIGVSFNLPHWLDLVFYAFAAGVAGLFLILLHINIGHQLRLKAAEM